MKKITVAAFLAFWSVISFAQVVPFETLQSFSKEINDFQKNANGKIYADGQAYYEVSFPETSFNVNFHNQLATKVVYKKNGDKETLEVTENIDFSQATEFKDMAYGGLVGTIRIYFPVGSVKTKYYENGELKHSYSETYVEIFYDKANNNDKYICTAKLCELISIIKETQNKPFEDWLLQSYYHNRFAKNAKFKMADNFKLESQLDRLIDRNNKFAIYEKGREFRILGDNINARIYLQKAIDLGNYDGYFWLASTYFQSNREEYTRLSQKGIDLDGFHSLVSSADWDYARFENFRNAIYLVEKAISVGNPDRLIFNIYYKELIEYYIKNKEYEKVKKILSSEAIFESGLSETDIIELSYTLLKESGNCKEAETLLNQTTNGIYTNEVKKSAYEKLEYLYKWGCKGTKGNKVSKNKKLAQEAAIKIYELSK